MYSGGLAGARADSAVSDIPRPAQTPFTTLSVLMILFCWGFFFQTLIYYFFLYLLLENDLFLLWNKSCRLFELSLVFSLQRSSGVERLRLRKGWACP